MEANLGTHDPNAQQGTADPPAEQPDGKEEDRSTTAATADAGAGESQPDPKPEPDPEPEPKPEPELPAICVETTEDPCLQCDQDACCEPLFLCSEDPACECHRECDDAELPEVCREECEPVPDLYERYRVCQEEHCPDACL